MKVFMKPYSTIINVLHGIYIKINKNICIIQGFVIMDTFKRTFCMHIIYSHHNQVFLISFSIFLSTNTPFYIFENHVKRR